MTSAAATARTAVFDERAFGFRSLGLASLGSRRACGRAGLPPRHPAIVGVTKSPCHRDAFMGVASLSSLQRTILSEHAPRDRCASPKKPAPGETRGLGGRPRSPSAMPAAVRREAPARRQSRTLAVWSSKWRRVILIAVELDPASRCSTVSVSDSSLLAGQLRPTNGWCSCRGARRGTHGFALPFGGAPAHAAGAAVDGRDARRACARLIVAVEAWLTRAGHYLRQLAARAAC